MTHPIADSDLVAGPGPVGQSSAPPAPAVGSSDPATFHRRRRGKIATLPLETRERINGMLQEGLSYPAILENLQPPPGDPPLPLQITENNLSDWFHGGYQDWLKEQFWRDEMRSRYDAFSSLLAGDDPVQLPENGLQLAAIGLCELLRDLSPGSRGPEADNEPDQYIRAANSLARLSRSILSLQKYRDACAHARAELKQLDVKRELTDDERRAIVRKVDQILGLNLAAS